MARLMTASRDRRSAILERRTKVLALSRDLRLRRDYQFGASWTVRQTPGAASPSGATSAKEEQYASSLRLSETRS